MNLTYRLTTLDDLFRHEDVLRPCYGAEAAVRERLPGVWRRLLAADAMVSSVVEDRDGPPGERVVAIGSSVFLPDDLLAWAKTPAAPPLSPELARRVWAGEMPVLDGPAIRRENERATRP